MKSIMRTLRTGIVCLLMTSLVSGCTLIDPYIDLKKSENDIESIRPDISQPVSLETALIYADTVKEKYRQYLIDREVSYKIRDYLLIALGISSAILGFEKNDTGLAAALGGVTVVGTLATYFGGSNSTQDAYLVGYEAVNCAIAVMSPWRIFTQGELAELKVETDILKGKITELSEKINTLKEENIKSKIEKLKEEINELKEKITQLTNKITQLTMKISKSLNKITQLTNEITQLTNEITQLTNEITQLTNEITQLTNEITDPGNGNPKQRQQNNKSKIDQLTAKVDELTAEITKADEITKAEIDSLIGRRLIHTVDTIIAGVDRAILNAKIDPKTFVNMIQILNNFSDQVSGDLKNNFSGSDTKFEILSSKVATQCGIDPAQEIKAPITLEPSGPTKFLNNKDTEVGYIIRGGQHPYYVGQPNPSHEGIMVRKIGAFSNAFQVAVKKDTPVGDYLILITDAAGQSKFLTVKVEKASEKVEKASDSQNQN